MTDTAIEIREFLTVALRRPVAPDEDYFALGLADSLFALELVVFVEERFDIRIEVDDLDLDSFRTAERIAALVERKRAGLAAGGETGAGRAARG
ncbi:phosphopantetheine-binding protein [Kitasatospora sp. NPDC087314]|uniref:phosphopantetheine-binding protein n=1 Tax=Kitasatospora sp. NPDC087314 TaxID=3364068 RepID=UPI003827970E